MEPEILVLDEPSSNLDPASRRELADILRSLDVTVLMVTHDLPYALELCPRSVVLSDGVDRRRRRDVRRAHRRRADAARTGSSCRSGSIPRTLRDPPAPGNLCLDPADAQRGHGSDPRRTTVAPSDDQLSSLSSARSRQTRERLAATIDQLALPGQPEDDRAARDQQHQGALRRRRTGNPRTDNILKVAGGVVGFVAFVVVIARRSTR